MKGRCCACLFTSGLFASGLFSTRSFAMAEAGRRLTRGHDPHGHGPFDCHGRLLGSVWRMFAALVAPSAFPCSHPNNIKQYVAHGCSKTLPYLLIKHPLALGDSSSSRDTEQ